MPIRIAILIFLLIGVYNNCSKMRTGAHGTSVAMSETPSLPVPGINELKSPRPAKICGESGYSYLMHEYLRENCIGCHAEGGMADPMLAANDLSSAYQAALFVAKDKFVESITENRLCGDCNLNPEGEVFKAIEEWIDSRFSDCQN